MLYVSFKLHGVISKKSIIFIFSSVRTSDSMALILALHARLDRNLSVSVVFVHTCLRIRVFSIHFASNISFFGGYTVSQFVEALCNKPEGRGFDSRWCHWNFSLT